MVAVITSEIFIPVFYRLGISSTYEVSKLKKWCACSIFTLFYLVPASILQLVMSCFLISCFLQGCCLCRTWPDFWY